MNEYDQLYEGSKLKHTIAATPKEETSLTKFIKYMDGTRKVRNTKRNCRQAQEHVVAERKRRDKLARRFNSLSALLPGLKKNDKATVLEDASNYILQLQAGVKELEETSVKGKDIIHESDVASIGRCNLTGHEADRASLADDIYNLPSSSSTYKHHIKARIIKTKVLVRIYCRKSPSLVQKTLNEIQKLQMTIICCSILPFDTGHIITVTAQMGNDMVTKRKDLVKHLQIALKDFM